MSGSESEVTNTQGTIDRSLLNEFWTRTRQINRLVLLVKDPVTIFVYWEVNDLRKRLIREHFQADWLGLPFFLQLYDVTDIWFDGYNAHSVRRIQVHPLTDNWYIHQVEPGRRYLADFGTVTLQGGFFTILRSNIVETPPKLRDGKSEPFIRFGAILANTVPSLSNPQVSKTNPAKPEPWQEQFDGYTLVERKQGEG